MARVIWCPCWRIIPARFPPIRFFERVSDPDEMHALFAVEALTNPRLRDEVGDIALTPLQDRISGPGAGVIMAAFTHLNPDGSRFSDGSYGVYYAAAERDTAIAETCHHRARFLAATAQPPIELDMQAWLTDLDGALHDLRAAQNHRAARDRWPDVYSKSNYAAARDLAKPLRAAGGNGLAYDSVRRAGGECAAVFRPPLLSNVRPGGHLCYVWDGQAITQVYEKRPLTPESTEPIAPPAPPATE